MVININLLNPLNNSVRLLNDTFEVVNYPTRVTQTSNSLLDLLVIPDSEEDSSAGIKPVEYFIIIWLNV